MAEAFMTYADVALALYYARNDAPQVEPLKAQIAALKEAVAKAEAIGEQRRQEAESARKMIAGMVMKIEALSKQTAKQSAANDKLQTEFDRLQAEYNVHWQRECRDLF
jgi:chromosome segregation ATPase